MLTFKGWNEDKKSVRCLSKLERKECAESHKPGKSSKKDYSPAVWNARRSRRRSILQLSLQVMGKTSSVKWSGLKKHLAVY